MSRLKRHHEKWNVQLSCVSLLYREVFLKIMEARKHLRRTGEAVIRHPYTTV